MASWGMISVYTYICIYMWCLPIMYTYSDGSKEAWRDQKPTSLTLSWIDEGLEPATCDAAGAACQQPKRRLHEPRSSQSP